MKQYVTFGADHVHTIGDKDIDHNCVAVFDAPNAFVGREKAFALFGLRFCMHYAGDEFDHAEMMRFFPRGLIGVGDQT